MGSRSRHGLCLLFCFALARCEIEQVAAWDEEQSFEPEVEILSPELGSTVHDDPVLACMKISRFQIPQDGGLSIRLDRGLPTLSYRPLGPSECVSLTDLEEGKHKIVAGLVNRDGETIVEDQVVFLVGKVTSWVRHHVSASGTGLSFCRVGSTPCSFSLTSSDVVFEENVRGTRGHAGVQKPGGFTGLGQGVGHSFVVELVGPARVVGHVEEVTPRHYVATYTLVDPGVYKMTVYLGYASGYALSDNPTEVAGSFMHQAISGSPFTVHAVEDHMAVCWANGSLGVQNPFRAPAPWCLAAPSGRWLLRSHCEKGGVSCGGLATDVLAPESQYGSDEVAFRHLWVGNTCRFKPYTKQHLRRCLDGGAGKKLVLLGDSLVRTLYFDIVRTLLPGISGNDWKIDEDSFGEDIAFVGGMPVPADLEVVAGQSLPPRAQKLMHLRYNHTAARLKYALARYIDPEKSNICVLSFGLHDVSVSTMQYFQANLNILRDIFAQAPCSRVIYMEHPAVHDIVMDRAHFTRSGDIAQRLYSRPKLRQATVLAREVMQAAGFEIFDARSVTLAMSDWTEDGVHYYYDGCYVGNPVSQTVAQLLLNAVCNPDDDRPSEPTPS